MKTISNSIRCLILAFLFLFANGCNRKKANNTALVESAKGNSKPIIKTLQPDTVWLSKSVPPSNFAFIGSPQIKELVGSDNFESIIPDEQGDVFFTNFDAESGFNIGDVNCTFMDKIGNLWIGSDQGVRKYNGKTFTYFSTTHGLAGNKVSAISQASDGSIWFTTDSGFSQFDGSIFRTKKFTEKNQAIEASCFFEDHAGNQWFGTAQGLFIITVSNLKNNSNKFHQINIQKGLVNNLIQCIYEDKLGNIWIGTAEGLSRIDAKILGHKCFHGECAHNLKSASEFSKHLLEMGRYVVNYTDAKGGLIDNDVKCIAEDIAGYLWIGTGGGVSRILVKNAVCKFECFQNFNMDLGLVGNIVRSICISKNNDIWFGTTQGISKFHPQSKFDNHVVFTNYSKSNQLVNDWVSSISEDKEGNIWIATDKGICRFDGNALRLFTTECGLANNDVTSIAEDGDGNLCFGTDGGGFSIYKAFYRGGNTSYFKNINDQNGIEKYIHSVAFDPSGKLWLGTQSSGVYSVDLKNKKVVNYDMPQGLPASEILCIAIDLKGNKWFGTREAGVSYFDGDKFVNIGRKHGLPSDKVNTIKIAKNGNIWIGTENGFAVIHNKVMTTYTTSQGLPNADVDGIAEDKYGNMWLGTDGGGLIRFDVESENPGFINYTILDGLPDNSIFQIEIGENNQILVGTGLGLAVISGFYANNSEIKSVDAQNNLPNTTLANYSPKIEVYNRSSGYHIVNVVSGSKTLFKDSKGIIWVATKTGLIRFNYNAMQKNVKPELEIQKIKINNEIIAWNNLFGNKYQREQIENIKKRSVEENLLFGNRMSEGSRDNMRKRFRNVNLDSISKWDNLPVNLELPYNNQITFEFGAILPAHNDLVKYQYKLEGYDAFWSAIGNKTSASFGNIQEGNYTFILKAQNAFGVWGKDIKYTFKVLPPWWRKWYMFIVYALGLMGFIYLFIQWNQRRLIRKEKVLKLQIQNATSEIVKQKDEIELQRNRSDELLLNILPPDVAEELKEKGSADAKHHEFVTVLFTDFKHFTQYSEKISAKQLVAELNDCFFGFDNIMRKYGLEKIKTIGDSYMAADGLGNQTSREVTNVIRAGLEMQKFIIARKSEREANGEAAYEMRVGIHSGPVVAGIVGVMKFAYDIWGDTVNIASRMESSGEAGKVNISEFTFNYVKESSEFVFIPRGKIEAKGKGEMHMYFVDYADCSKAGS